MPFFSKIVCPDGWIRFKKHCYKLFPQRLDWSSAMFFCIDRNSALISLHAVEESNFVKTSILASSAEQFGVWTGGYHGQNKIWKWNDNSPFSSKLTTPTADVQHNCIYLLKASNVLSISTVECDTRTLPFICKMGDGKLE